MERLPQPQAQIRILIADNSPISRRLLNEVIGSQTDMVVVGEAANGPEAVRMNASLKPHIIAMDLTLPLMDGLETTEVIMGENPTRIVMLGEASQRSDADLMRRVTAVGALDFAVKPHKPDDIDLANHLVKTLRAMSRVRVIRHWRSMNSGSTDDTHIVNVLREYPGLTRRIEIVLIVSSTGGPHALETIMKLLPVTFPLPMVIVQHISGEFVGNMVTWLSGATPLRIKLAEHGEKPMPGHIYIAPSDYHLRITFNGRFALSNDTEDYIHVPSGNILLESAAEVYGPNAIGVVLTGMGEDGAKGLLRMREQGAHTIVQDEATSIVFGMPKAAIDLGGSEYVEPVEKIAGLLVKLAMGGDKT